MIELIEEKNEVFNELVESIKSGISFWIPMFSDDNIHPSDRELSFIYFYIQDNNKEYVIPFNHSECINLDVSVLDEFVTDQQIFIYNKKDLLYFNNSICKNIDFFDCYELKLIEYFYYNKVSFIKKCKTDCHNFYDIRHVKNINKIIPILKHFEYCSSIMENVLNIFDKIIDQKAVFIYDKIIINTMHLIEKNRIKYDEKYLSGGYTKDGYLYNMYNMYTITSRPSNTFGGLNLLALNKTTDERKAFVSRFNDGKLIMFDYETCHPRLILDLIDYTIPKDVNVYRYIAEKYFDKKDLSEDDYNALKNLTMKLTYSEEFKDINIDYFKKINIYIQDLWKKFNLDGYIETPLFKRKIYKSFFIDINKRSLFNYLLQMYEFERNMLLISDLLKNIDSFKSKIILYVYDSILVDYNPEDGEEFIYKVKNYLEANKYPVSVKIGNNYKELTEI